MKMREIMNKTLQDAINLLQKGETVVEIAEQ